MPICCIRALGLAATLLFATSAAYPSAPEIAAAPEFVDPLPASRGFDPVVPFEPRARVELGRVWWTAPRAESVKQVAERFGIAHDDLRALDPSLADGRVAAGQRVLVYRHDPAAPSRSVGAPNRGRLEHAVPFPEGDGWALRAYRPRTWATRHVVVELAASITEWRERFPEAQPVLLGEFSRRGGGTVRPHRSHRSGRDVDVGYVLLVPPAAHKFTVGTPRTMDAAATWGLVQRLLASGAVESIFMAESVQNQLLPHALASVAPERLPSVFSVLATDPRAKKQAILRAWGGHDDHMHVRFACTDDDVGCRDAERRKKGKKKKGRSAAKRRGAKGR
jgi:murein endopeptidase